MDFELLGNRVLLDRPTLKESKIELSPEVKASLEQEMFKKFQKMKVFAVGKDVTAVTTSNYVYIPSYSINNAEVLEIDGEYKLLVRETEIAIKYNK